MQFSLRNNKNLENVFQKFNCRLSQERSQRNKLFNKRRTRLYQGRGNRPSRTSSLTSPSATPLPSTSLNQSPLIGMESIDLLSVPSNAIMTPQIEKENQMQDVIETVLTGNKDKIQSKEEFMNALKNIDPDNFVEFFKNMGEKLFENKNAQDTTTATDATTTQLATPITTPMDNAILDLNMINSPLNQTLPSPEAVQSEMNNTFIDPLIVCQDELNPFKSPDPVSKIIEASPAEILAPSPIIQSPLVSSLLGNTPSQQTMQSPLVSPLVSSLLGNTPSQPTMQSPLVSPLITSLLAAETPAQPTMQSPLVTALLNETPSQPTIQSPLIAALLNETSSQPTVQSPLVDAILNNDPSVQPSSAQTSVSEISEILDTISQSNPSESQDSIDSILMPSPAIQNSSIIAQSPFLMPLEANLDVQNESFLRVNNLFPSTPSILSGNSLLGSGNNVSLGEEVIGNVDDNNDSNLEKVDQLMKAFNEIIQNNENVQPSVATGSVEETGFPSNDCINQCAVNEDDFNFTNENITKLVRLAPVEVVQEDVVELERLAHQKRGKGRPRKPRKFSICPFAHCHKKFNREFNLKEHIRIHNPRRNKDFVCQWCNEGFYSSSVLSRHIASIHQGEKFFCKNCGKKFNRKDALHRHEKISCHLAH